MTDDEKNLSCSLAGLLLSCHTFSSGTGSAYSPSSAGGDRSKDWSGGYILDGVADDLDFGSCGAAWNIIVVLPAHENGRYDVLDFKNGQFFDTPQYERYECRERRNRLQGRTHGVTFELEYADDRVVGLWMTQGKGEGETAFYSKQDIPAK